jgi:hypothetical protein
MSELRSSRLTKRFLLSLPNGVYLMANIAGSNGNPIFGEYVISPPAEREKQWERIKEAGANNRLCRIFKNKNQALAWIEEAK